MINYENLQNGSDVRGVSLPGALGEEVTLNTDAAHNIAMAFVSWLSARLHKPIGELRIGVGRDSRNSGPDLQRAVIGGIAASGAQAVDCAMASTPAMFMTTVLPEIAFDGSVMITASHLPWNRNGLKFFTREGGLEAPEIGEILHEAASGVPAAKRPGRLSACDVITPYAGYLRRVIVEGVGAGEKPLAGFKIAVDAGNGAGGFFATRVLLPLGADVSASVYLEPDGSFPNHIPNPEFKPAMDSFREVVLAHGCDLGFLFDTDVDRVGAVDADGMELSRNRLIALMGAIVAEEAPGSTVVTDSVTSEGLARFLEGLGLRHHRFKRGYKNVINEGIRLNEAGETCLLAMETSGHAALRENYFLDDGAYLSAKIIVRTVRLRREGRSLSDLLSGLHEAVDARELRFPLLPEDYRAAGEAVLEALRQYAEGQPGWVAAPDNHEGLRYSLPAHEGWFLLRQSLHDPLMPLNIESNKEGGAAAILEELTPFLRGMPTLDCRPLDR